jgi:hypothetical protein
MVESQKYYIAVNRTRILWELRMRRKELPKPSKFAVFKSFVLFNLAAVVGFLLGTAAFAGSMFVFPNPTFSWLFGNAIGGLSHFGANFVMQRQTKEGIAKNFVVFNATGIIGFLVASAMFAVAIIFIKDSNAAWLCGSLVGTLSHFVLNHKAMKFNFSFKR